MSTGNGEGGGEVGKWGRLWDVVEAEGRLVGDEKERWEMRREKRGEERRWRE